MNRSRIVLLVLFVLLAGNVWLTIQVDDRADRLDNRVDELERQQETLDARQSRALEELLVGATANESGEFADATAVNTTLIAYDPSVAEATLVPLRVRNFPGDGIYVDVKPIYYGSRTQISFQRARQYAEATEYEPQYGAYLVQIRTPARWDYVNGGSAGLPTAVAIAATDPDVRFNDSVAVTGALDENGRVMEVDYVREKAYAARDAGKDLLLVPPGESVDIDGIRVVEVETVEEAVDYAIEPTTPDPRISGAFAGELPG